MHRAFAHMHSDRASLVLPWKGSALSRAVQQPRPGLMLTGQNTPKLHYPEYLHTSTPRPRSAASSPCTEAPDVPRPPGAFTNALHFSLPPVILIETTGSYYCAKADAGDPKITAVTVLVLHPGSCVRPQDHCAGRQLSRVVLSNPTRCTCTCRLVLHPGSYGRTQCHGAGPQLRSWQLYVDGRSSGLVLHILPSARPLLHGEGGEGWGEG